MIKNTNLELFLLMRAHILSIYINLLKNVLSFYPTVSMCFMRVVHRVWYDLIWQWQIHEACMSEYIVKHPYVKQNCWCGRDLVLASKAAFKFGGGILWVPCRHSRNFWRKPTKTPNGCVEVRAKEKSKIVIKFENY